MNFLSLLTAALSLGCCYGLLAIGYGFLYHLCRLFNYAHGDLLMLCGYLSLFLSRLGVKNGLLLLLSPLLGGLVSFLSEKLVYAPIKGAKPIDTMLAGIGLSFLFQGAALLLFGATPVSFSDTLALSFGGVRISAFLWITPLLLIPLSLLYAKSPLFLRLRAMADDPFGAVCCGISENRCRQIVFLFSGALAGLCGFLYGQEFYLAPAIGTLLGIKAFAASVLGGGSSPLSSFLGGLLLGLAETLLASLFPSAFLDAFVFLLLLGLLFFRIKRPLQRA